MKSRLVSVTVTFYFSKSIIYNNNYDSYFLRERKIVINYFCKVTFLILKIHIRIIYIFRISL